MKKLLVACLASLALAGCGDDVKPSGGTPGGLPGVLPGALPGGMPGSMPGALPGSIPGTMPSPTNLDAYKDMLKGGTIELTDDMLERYVGLMKEMKGAKPNAALFAKFRFNAMEYVQIARIIGTSTVRTAMTDAGPKMKKSLEALKKRRDAEKDPQIKAMLDRQIEATEKQLGGMGTIGTATEVDRKNMEVLERWKDRLEAAGK